jgi:hypothetical protein
MALEQPKSRAPKVGRETLKKYSLWKKLGLLRIVLQIIVNHMFSPIQNESYPFFQENVPFYK